MKQVLVTGAGGFIGNHLVRKLKQQGCWVRGADLKYPEFSPSTADHFVLADLRNPERCRDLFDRVFDEVYQLAADMGGAGFIFTGEHDAAILHNSATINLNMLHYGVQAKMKKIFYSSSACVYPAFNQIDPDNPRCSEDSAYPAQPDSEYGWEKLFSERLYFAFMRNHGLPVRVARFHNIFGVEGTYKGGREKAPAAICRKVAEAEDGTFIEIWGNGSQTRSFLSVEECLEGVERFMRSDFSGPLNIGSDEMVTINQLARYIIDISGKRLEIRHIQGPMGVLGRNSDNHLIREKLDWGPSALLRQGLERTYWWVKEQQYKAEPAFH